MASLSRRRFLVLTAGFGTIAALTGATAARSGADVARWRGTAMGSAASITLAHPDGQRILHGVLAEIARLEAVFSLYRADSALSRLNREGTLTDPPFELVECLSLAGGLHRLTGGSFDPTVQPLWTTYAEALSAGRMPSSDEIGAARARVGWTRVIVEPARIALDQGMALTLNGIAQGFIADKVVALLAADGLDDVLIDTGELRALGGRPDGGDWEVTLANGRGEVPLRDRALATSAPHGTTFDQAGRIGHILDPRTGAPAESRWTQISVSASSAALADGLSTAFCLMDPAEIDVALLELPDARLVSAH